MIIAAAEPESVPSGHTIRILKITPDNAADFLSRNSVNRRLDMGQVGNLARIIRRGEWKLTHQGIAFDENDQLLDGQHRLRAVIEANSAVEMYAFYGLPRDTFPVLDIGKRRSASDTLYSTGAKYLPLLSSTIRHVNLFHNIPNERWTGAQAHVSNDIILSSYHADKNRYEEAVTVGRELAKYLFATQTAVSVAYFVTTEVAPAAEVDTWLEGLKSGASLDAGDPRLALREVPRETPRRGAKRRMTMRDQVAIYIKAWNAWVNPDTASTLRLQRLRKGEKMPIPSPVGFND
ncbi:hypothetical protein [Streptomyces albidoflavus]|uniref:hypothetical protein n=1 Tax=Streptomyces albidoflavus TaxID=1886 RepID=UPI00101E5FC3|nr:hypothetical protein [Streptomyces albidoflavus]